MRGLQKSKRVYWAPGANLCQIRLFLSEESPSQVGLGVQDHLQAKASWSHPTGTATDGILPPGFEGGHPPNHVQIKLSEVPVIKWRSPPRLILNLAWQVVAGEENEEVEAQNQRELRVLEAVYPRLSAIPPNPTFPVDTEDSRHNDHHVPSIPMTPIEDEDAADTPDVVGQANIAMSSQPQLQASAIPPSQCGISNMSNMPVSDNKQAAGPPPDVEPDVLGAASAAFTTINRSNEHGGLIDHDLLMKILSNPQLIKLASDYGSLSSVQNTTQAAAPFVPSIGPPPTMPLDRSHFHINRAPSSVAATSSGPYYAHPNGDGLGIAPNSQFPSPGAPQRIPTSSVPPARAPQAKDFNYYKKLIQQHGGETQEAPQQFVGCYNHQIGANKDLVKPKPRDARPKVMKPCIYFNSSRGCRNGDNCPYQHDALSQQRGSSTPDVHCAKRMKMDREISS